MNKVRCRVCKAYGDRGAMRRVPLGWSCMTCPTRQPDPRPPLKPRSDGRTEQMVDHRIPLVRKLIAGGVKCAICPALRMAGVPTPSCPGVQGLHERRKSSSGGSRLNLANLVPACNWSNGFIESEPHLVRELFGDRFVVREGDPEWVVLGRRADRSPARKEGVNEDCKLPGEVS